VANGQIVQLESGQPVEIYYRSMRRSIPDGWYFHFPGAPFEYYGGQICAQAIEQAQNIEKYGLRAEFITVMVPV
jgi:hypothetical protein